MSKNEGYLVIPDSSIPREIRDFARKQKTLADIKNRFTYHPPKGDQASRYEEIRGIALRVALQLSELCPESRELSTALTKLDEVVFFANAAIARNE